MFSGGGRIEKYPHMTIGEHALWASHARLALRSFVRCEAGLASTEWIIIAAGATGLGLLLLESSQINLGRYSADVRTELQDGRFNADWARDLPVQMD
jgi:hypothetical protein